MERDNVGIQTKVVVRKKSEREKESRGKKTIKSYKGLREFCGE